MEAGSCADSSYSFPQRPRSGRSVGGAVIVWRRNPRIGSAFVNAVVNPGLVRRGLAGSGRSEIGTLEHVGRRSGIRRLTPIHPESTADGFRIMVPLGTHSEWARNVLAAGHCRLQLHDVVYDLDEPMMVPAGDVDDLPLAVRAVAAALDFQYLKLRTFDVNPGTLDLAGPGASLLDADLAVADDAEAGDVSPSDAHCQFRLRASATARSTIAVMQPRPPFPPRWQRRSMAA